MEDYEKFIDGFYKLTGLDLNAYKRPQMERRLTSLMAKYAFASVRDLLLELSNSESLRNEFLDKATINVSEFYRNPERWRDLARVVSEYQLAPGETFNIWSAACSSGEEPYSLSMFMQEETRWKFRILATDLDAKILQKAQQGIYQTSQIRGVENTLLKKYFHQQPSGLLAVDAAVKQNVEFARHNLLDSTYPTAKDLIVCRNVLIYFTDETKAQIIRKFVQSLKPGGILFLGSTETIANEQHSLKSVAPFIYRRVR